MSVLIKKQFIDISRGVEFYEYTFKVTIDKDVKLDFNDNQEIVELIENKLIEKYTD